MGVAGPALVVIVLMLRDVAMRSEMGMGMSQSGSVAMQIAPKRVVCNHATHRLKASGGASATEWVLSKHPRKKSPPVVPNEANQASLRTAHARMVRVIEIAITSQEDRNARQPYRDPGSAARDCLAS
jgi:hypothetical protein